MTVPRRRELPDAAAIARLKRAATKKKTSDTELRQAVYAASDAGGSVRVIAELAQVSTRTIQNWLADRS